MSNESQRQMRIVIAAPIAKATAIATWLNNNIGPETVPPTLGTGVSETGKSPPTYAICSMSVSLEHARQIANRLLNLGSQIQVTKGTWDGLAKDGKRAFLNNRRDAIFTNFGIFVDISDNLGKWFSATELFEALKAKGVSLQVIDE